MKLIPIYFGESIENLAQDKSWNDALKLNLQMMDNLLESDNFELKNKLQIKAEPDYWTVAEFINEFCRIQALLQCEIELRLSLRNQESFFDAVGLDKDSYWLLREACSTVFNATYRLSTLQPLPEFSALFILNFCQAFQSLMGDRVFFVLENLLEPSRLESDFEFCIKTVTVYVEAIRREYEASDNQLAADMAKKDLNYIINMSHMLKNVVLSSKTLLRDVIESKNNPLSASVITAFEIVTHLQPKIAANQEIVELGKAAKRQLCECFFAIITCLYSSFEQFTELCSILMAQLNDGYVDEIRDYLSTCPFIADVEISCDLSGWLSELMKDPKFTPDIRTQAEFLITGLEHLVSVTDNELSKNSSRNTAIYIKDMISLNGSNY